MSHTYVIAEAGVNHNGKLELARELVRAAALAGADAVKFQTFSAERLASANAPKANYQKKTTNPQESQLDMLRKLELPEEWHFELQELANSLNIQFISTAFDEQSLSFLETLNLPFYKIPSGEITNAPLLLAFARTRKPIILSTGMASLGEVEQALAIIAYGYQHHTPPSTLEEVNRFWTSAELPLTLLNNSVSLLHCTSMYPTVLDEVNLRAMDTLRNAFQLPVGYSDHTQGKLVPLAAVARGAKIIEKHFTLDRNLPGPDHSSSLETSELVEMISLIRDIERTLGHGLKMPQASEWDTRLAARKRVVAVNAISCGELLTELNIGCARSSGGKSAVFYWDTIGTIATKNFEIGDGIE